MRSLTPTALAAAMVLSLTACADDLPSEADRAATAADAAIPGRFDVTADRASEPDLTWYDGVEYYLLFPSANSSDENQFTFGCFNLGPDQTGKHHHQVGTLYASFLPGVSQDSCPDGTVLHDHIVSAIPGDADYAPYWRPVFVLPTSSFDPSITPRLESEAAILAAVDAGQVVLVPQDFIVHAEIAGRAGG